MKNFTFMKNGTNYQLHVDGKPTSFGISANSCAASIMGVGKKATFELIEESFVQWASENIENFSEDDLLDFREQLQYQI